uniref:Costars domain-containing protein n=1 Tax=Syphacia muris TaxID=451379 RepID=A0A0N5AB63_9BILA
NSISFKFRNPYSDSYSVQHFDTKAADYGRPPKGSKTEARGIKAGVHIMHEVLFLMEIINDYATGEPPDRVISFGELFHIYEHYSNKVLVGMLIRARKYGLVDFEGEMLYQRQDDDKPIMMLKSILEIRKMVQSSNDPVNCISIKK